VHPEPVHEFAMDLKELHISCGKPSYARIRELAREHGAHPLSPATISEVLNGRRMPKAEFVASFVRAVLRHRDGDGLPARHEAEVRKWRRKWQHALLRPADATAKPVPRGAGPGPRPEAGTPLPFDAVLDRVLGESGRGWADAPHGCYAVYDLTGDVIHIGQFGCASDGGVREHLADAVALRLVDPREVAELELWPVRSLRDVDPATARQRLDQVERAVYRVVLGQGDPAGLPPSKRFPLLDERTRSELQDGDARIARHAEELARLAATVLEHRRVGDEVRRTLAVRAFRLAHSAATHLARMTGLPGPEPGRLDLRDLTGDG
jgi:hypothetical protein